jgi:TonB family protein
MQRAYVLSGDAKSLGILNQILEELAVTAEYSHDLPAAIKKISTESFDAVLVDCDDIQTATHFFGILRGSSFNHGSMSIAIVDGKAGVPTAFRLGAKTVLSKPLSLEQARTTLRNALAVQRRDAQESKMLAAAAASHMSVGATTTENSTPQPAHEEPAKQDADAHANIMEQPVTASAQGAAAAPARETKTEMPQKTGTLGSEKTVPANANSDKPTPDVAPKSLALPKDSSEKPPITLVSREASKPQAAAAPTVPTFGMLHDSQPKSKRGLFVGIAVVLVVAGAGVVWTTQPKLRETVLWKYGQLTHRNVAPNQTTPPVPQGQTSTDAQAAAQVTPLATAPAPAPDPSTLAQGFQENPPAATTAPAPAAENADPVVVPADLADAHVTHRVAAWYPTKARHAHIKGNVILNANVGADGTVQSVDVVKGNAMLQLAAAEAVKQWQYQPYYQNGQPVPFQTQVSVVFPPKAPSKP